MQVQVLDDSAVIYACHATGESVEQLSAQQTYQMQKPDSCQDVELDETSQLRAGVSELLMWQLEVFFT